MKRLANVSRVLFSLYFWTASFVIMGVGALLTFVLLVFRVPYQKVHGWVTAPLFGATVPMATVRFRVHYHPDFDPNVRSVFGQNHINLLDGMVAARVIPHAFSGLMNAWQFKIPIYGWLMRLSKGIPVDMTRREKLIQSISDAARNRKEIGMSVLTFPEGHRTMTGEVGPFKRGVFLMARNAEMPFVPIAVRGLYEVNNKNIGWKFEPFRDVDVFVGPQFNVSGLDTDGVAALVKRVRGYLVACIEDGAFPSPAASETPSVDRGAPLGSDSEESG